MDPLSLTVNTVTLATLAAKLVALGNTYSGALKNQQTEVQLLVREIGLLSGILNGVSGTLDTQQAANGRAMANILEGPLEECRGQLEELHEFLLKQMQGKNRLRRLGRRLTWPMKEKETKEWIERIERFKRTFTLGLQVDNMGARGQLQSEVADLKRIHEETRKEKMEAKKRRKFREALVWISPASQVENHVAARRLQEPGTGERILQHPTYQTWVSDARSMLWLHARLGLGKTISASMIIDSLAKEQKAEHIAYFYYDPEKSRTADVYGSILSQLLESTTTLLPDYLETYFDDSQHRRPYEHELRDMLLKFLPSISGAVAIIIDGLEESKYFEEVLKGLQEVYQSTELRMLITSRDGPDLASPPPGFRELEILPSLMRDDIVVFITQEIERQATMKRLKPPLKEEVIKVVSRHADGVFRKARSSLEQVGKMRTDRDVKNALNALKPRPEPREGHDSGFEEEFEPPLEVS